MKFYLVRHGETDWNRENKIQGQNDIPLNGTGKKQAGELANRLRLGAFEIKEIYTSPLKRAVATAETAGRALGLVPVVAEGLREMSLGSWEGYTWQQVKECFPAEYQTWYRNRRYQMPPGGESYQQLLERLLPVLGSLKHRAEGDVLLVTHSAVIMTLLSYVHGTPFEDMVANYKTGNTGIAELDMDKLDEGALSKKHSPIIF